MAKYPETFFPIVKEYLEEDESYESFMNTEFLSCTFTPYLRCGVCCDNEDVKCDH